MAKNNLAPNVSSAAAEKSWNKALELPSLAFYSYTFSFVSLSGSSERFLAQHWDAAPGPLFFSGTSSPSLTSFGKAGGLQLKPFSDNGMPVLFWAKGLQEMWAGTEGMHISVQPTVGWTRSHCVVWSISSTNPVGVRICPPGWSMKLPGWWVAEVQTRQACPFLCLLHVPPNPGQNLGNLVRCKMLQSPMLVSLLSLLNLKSPSSYQSHLSFSLSLFLVTPRGTQDLSSLTRGWNRVPYSGSTES